jgi:hypothetical protein
MDVLTAVVIFAVAYLVGVWQSREATRQQLQSLREVDQAAHSRREAELVHGKDVLADALARLLNAVRDKQDLDTAVAAAAAALDGQGYTGDLAAARAALQEAEAELVELRQRT